MSLGEALFSGFAGALQGAGTGMVKVAESNVLERREAALVAARAQEATVANDRVSAREQADRKGRSALQDDAQEHSALMGAAGARSAAAEKSADRAFTLQQDAVKRAFDRDEKAKDRSAKLTESFGKPISTYTDEISGDVTEIYRTPEGNKPEVYKGIARKRPTASAGGSSLYGDMPDATGAPGAPAPLAAPKSLDEVPTTEGGFNYKPGPGGRMNQANWTKK